MNPIVINGTVLCDNITGIPRYVYETVVRLDKLIRGTGLTCASPTATMAADSSAG